MHRVWTAVAGGVMLLAASTTTLAEEHHCGVEVGVDAGNTLAVAFDFDEAISLPVVDGPILFGWAASSPGMVGLEESEHDLAPLSEAARLEFVLVSIDAGLHVYEAGLTGEITVGGANGVIYNDVEGHNHWHPTWFIDSTVVDPELTPVSLQFKLIDTGASGYADSDVYTMTFVPEPTSAGLLACGLLALTRRRG